KRPPRVSCLECIPHRDAGGCRLCALPLCLAFQHRAQLRPDDCKYGGWCVRFESWPRLVDDWHHPRPRLRDIRLSPLRRQGCARKRGAFITTADGSLVSLALTMSTGLTRGRRNPL